MIGKHKQAHKHTNIHKKYPKDRRTLNFLYVQIIALLQEEEKVFFGVFFVVVVFVVIVFDVVVFDVVVFVVVVFVVLVFALVMFVVVF